MRFLGGKRRKINARVNQRSFFDWNQLLVKGATIIQLGIHERSKDSSRSCASSEGLNPKTQADPFRDDNKKSKSNRDGKNNRRSFDSPFAKARTISLRMTEIWVGGLIPARE
jgi:hypothetical protein